MNEYALTVGLEIHVELRTQTKMFCSSKNDSHETRPNVNICPVCMGYPGTLPVINKEAVRQVLRFGLAVGGTLANYTEFDRKNYFYPDIPKGYQISQYAHPLITGGEVKGVALTRVHLEEDTAKSTHDTGDQSLVDFNRAGVPLMELVTEPVIHDAADAVSFAKELQLLLRTLGLSDANMEKGQMRVEANISVSKTDTLGTKVEVKNLNSFKAVEKAIRFEMNRHIEALERGEKLVQETRGWNENTEKTFAQRSKENSHDYRYFPDPDLPKLFIQDVPEFKVEVLQATLPELPKDQRGRLAATYGLKAEDAEVFVANREWREFFEESMEGANQDIARLASNYMNSDLINLVKASDASVGESKSLRDTKLTPTAFRELADMIHAGEISSRGAKDILKEVVQNGGGARRTAEKFNLFQKSDTAELQTVAKTILEANIKAVEDYKKGNTALLQFFVGQAMKATKGSGNPVVLKQVFEDLLK